MTPETEAEYRRLARHFYTTIEGDPTPKRIADALKARATETTPGYWRRLRRAVVVDQRAQGYEKAAKRLEGLKNPATKKGSRLQPGAKRLKAKSVSDADTAKVLAYLGERGDSLSMAVIQLVRLTGARPAEIASMQINGDGSAVRIFGAKKSEQAQRGADRDLAIPAKQRAVVRAALAEIQGRAGDQRLPVEDVAAEVRRTQDRISRASRAVFTRRKLPPVVYSWRHQLGSNLKASGLSRVEVAYLMGHQSTASVDRYGDRRKASGSAGSGLRPADSADLSQVRELHREPGEIGPAIQQAERARQASGPELTPW